jgi:UDP-N-acetylglucosamine acyltransferase
MTGIVKDVPPYCFASGARAELAGINSVGLQRAGFTEEQIGRVKQAYKIFFRSNLQTAEALAQLETELGRHPEVAHFIAFIKGSERGVTR